MGADDKGTETKTSLKFTPEAEAALAQELSGFLDLLAPRERNIQGQLGQLLGQSGPVTTGQVPGLDPVTTLLTQVLQQTIPGLNVSPDAYGELFQQTQTGAQDYANAFRTLALQTAAQTPSFLDPRFAPLLQPTTSSKTSPTDTQVAVDTAKAVAQVAGAAAT